MERVELMSDERQRVRMFKSRTYHTITASVGTFGGPINVGEANG